MTERRYPIRNRFSGKVEHLPISEYRQRIGRVEPTTGKQLYEGLAEIPGLVLGPEGPQQSMIPPDRQFEAAREQGPLRLLKSDKDRAWEQARQAAVERGKQQAAVQRHGAEVFLDSVLSGVSFGGFSYLENAIAGEGAAEAKARSIAEHRGAYLGGQATSMVLLGLLPIPGLGMASGAQKGLRAGSVFELAAQAGSKARGAKVLAGEGFLKEFGRRVTGAWTAGAVAEVPLSAAIEAASIVDNNKQLTAESIGAEFLTGWGQQWLLASSIAGVTSFGFAALGSAARAAGRPAVRKFDDLLEAEAKAAQAAGQTTQEFYDSGFRGLWRYTSRKHLRGRFFGLGDIIETQGYKVARRLAKGEAGKKASETRIGRWLAGSDADDFINLHMTNQQAIQALDNATTAPQLRKAADVLMNNLDDPQLLQGVAFIRENAEQLIPARRKVSDLLVDSRSFAEKIKNIDWQHPKKAVTGANRKTANTVLQRGLDEAMPNAPQLSGSFNQRLDKVLEIRKGLDRSQRVVVDDAISEAFPRMRPVLDNMNQLENAADNILRLTDEFETRGIRGAYNVLGAADEAATNPNSLRANVREADGIFRKMTNEKVNAVKDKTPFFGGDRPPYKTKGKATYSTIDTRLNDLRKGVDALGQANIAVNRLMRDARPLLKAPKPMTQAQILAAQVETVMTTKQRIKATLAWMATKGGGARHTAVFGGVYLFRDMKSQQEKRAAFRMYTDGIASQTATPETLMEYVGSLVAPAATFDMGLGAALADTQATAASYLRKQMPTSSDPAMLPEDFSSAEIENFFEALGALMSPISVLATAKDGSISEQGIDAIRTVYPEMYLESVIEVGAFVREFAPKLSHNTLVGLDSYTGYALGYVDGPGPNLTFQPPYYQTTGQAQAAGVVGGPENRRMDLKIGSTPAQKVGSM